MTATTTMAKLTTIIVQIVGQDTLLRYKLATDHTFLETMKNRMAKQKMVTAEDRIYVYQRITTDDEMALLECLCDDGEVIEYAIRKNENTSENGLPDSSVDNRICYKKKREYVGKWIT
eukprot:Pgem_evm1s15366